MRPPQGGWQVCRGSIRAAAVSSEAAVRRLASLPGEYLGGGSEQ